MSESDAQLLRRYARSRDESAFEELVKRHGSMVYGAALRQCLGDEDAAKDIVQTVFCDLARKARSLRGDIVLAGWLHRATVLTAAQFKRSTARRVLRESKAMEGSELLGTDDNQWTEIAPLVDQLLSRLNDKDRDVLLLRFFQERSLCEIAQALGCGETGAHQRISRALEKLRCLLVRSGVKCSTEALEKQLSTHAIQIIPAALIGAVASGATLHAAKATVAFQGVSNILTMTKLKTSLIASLVVVAVTAPIFVWNQRVEDTKATHGIASAAAGQTDGLVNLPTDEKQAVPSLDEGDYSQPHQ